MPFHEKITALRKERKETQDQLAKEVGIATRTYQDLEAGRYLPRQETFIALADHFGVSLDYLAGRTEVREIAGASEPERSEMP